MYEKEKSSMSESERNQKGDALKQEYDSFQKEYYTFQEELENKQKEMMGRLYLKIKDAIKKVGDAGNYTFIFDQQTPLYYGKNAEDVTIKVMQEMDNIK